MNKENISLTTTIPQDYHDLRLDLALSKLFPDYSRERIKGWILDGKCLVDNKKLKPRDKVEGGEFVVIDAETESAVNWGPEDLDIDIDVVFEDDDIIVINKPANLVVHPGNSNSSGTLVNYLLYKYPELESLPRGGIVHRLDKDTTGLMVVARSIKAHKSLTDQLKDKSVSRIYDAIVWGVRISGNTISEPIGRNPKDRTKMAVVDNSKSKEATTHFRILEKFSSNMHVEVVLETGRTHQIRVHMTHINHPLVGDKTYGRQRRLKGASPQLQEKLDNFSRQALHAKELSLIHPISGKSVTFKSELPEDMQDLLNALRNNYDI